MLTNGTTIVGSHGQRYELTDRVGRGGGGDVYKAKWIQRSQFVAVKFLTPQYSFVVDVIRFIREHYIAKLKHDNIYCSSFRFRHP